LDEQREQKIKWEGREDWTEMGKEKQK
jgi:hypothetical protein